MLETEQIARKIKIVIMVEGKPDEVVDVDGCILFLGKITNPEAPYKEQNVSTSFSTLGEDAVIGTLILNAEVMMEQFRNEVRALNNDAQKIVGDKKQ